MTTRRGAWTADRYDDDLLGLAQTHAEPQQEVEYLLSMFEDINPLTRRGPYLAATSRTLLATTSSPSLTLAAGALVAFQPPANALLGRVAGDNGAALFRLALATAIVAVLLVTVGSAGQLRGLGDLRPEHRLGGFAGAERAHGDQRHHDDGGAGGVTAAVVASQLIVPAVLDRLGCWASTRRRSGGKDGSAPRCSLPGGSS